MDGLFGPEDERFETADEPERHVLVAVERSVDRYPAGLLYRAPASLGIEAGH